MSGLFDFNQAQAPNPPEPPPPFEPVAKGKMPDSLSVTV